MAVAERVSAERGESLGDTVSPALLEMDQNTNVQLYRKQNKYYYS